MEDSAAMLGLIVTVLGILLTQITGIAVFDGLASAVIGLILGEAAVWLAIETKGLLIGEATGRDLVAGIRDIAAGSPRVGKVNEYLPCTWDRSSYW